MHTNDHKCILPCIRDAPLRATWVTAFGSELKLAPLSLKAKRLQTKDSPRALFVKVREEFSNSFLLESAIGEKRLAEYSFIGFEPQTTVTAKDGSLKAASADGRKDTIKTVDPLRELRKLVAVPDSNLRNARPFRFIGGAVGYISYDSVRYWERLPKRRETTSPSQTWSSGSTPMASFSTT